MQQVDIWHGTPVADPYRWLEQDVRTSREVADWVSAENQLTFAFLDTLPDRPRIRTRLAELWNFERFGLPIHAGKNYFYRKNDGLQNQSVLYVQRGLEAEPRAIIDPNAWSDDGATAMAEYYPSPDGTRVAYTIQDGGTDWRSARVLDVAQNTLLDDDIHWIKFSDLSWSADGSGFYYSRYPEPDKSSEYQELNFNHQVYFHRLGTPQSEDTLIYARPEQPDQGFGAHATDDGHWLLITVWHGTDERYELVLLDLTRPGSAPRALITGFDNEYALAGNEGATFYFRTNRDAPRGRIIAMDVNHPEPGAWREVVPEDASTLVDASLVGGRLVAEYLQDAHTSVRLFDTDGKAAGEVRLPGLGYAEGFEGKDDSPETFFVYSSFNQPPQIERLDTQTGQTATFKSAKVAFNPDDYIVEQVFYTSADGTRIPMFITHRRGVQRDGTNPTLLYGYGGFNIPITPEFLIARMGWLDMGGVYAVANLRGGGEYGAAWHDAGRLHNKQNVFDDFIAAAHYLIDQKWTSSAHLGIYGRSNGGLLIGAVENQAPELFAATLPTVGVMDMLRFNQFTAGRFWVDDYGDPANEADFRTLYAYSPYHNIRDGVHYPATLVTTADTDDRVVPGHSFKYIARLQAAQASDAPVLIRIETRAGHGTGKPTDKQIDETADMWAFVAHFTGLTLPEDYGRD